MLDVNTILQSGGLLLIALIIFAESGMMVGFLFPGDTLLFSAGILAAAGGYFSLPEVMIVIAVSAILGDNIGYHIGARLGPRLFKKDSLVFRHDYIMRAEKFYEKYGSKTMLIAHFVPIVRTFAPVTAGAGKMPLKQFMIYDAIGDIAWTVIVTLSGYYIGSRIPGIEHYIEPVLIGIILIFLIPTLYHAFKDPRVRSAITTKFRRRAKSNDN